MPYTLYISMMKHYLDYNYENTTETMMEKLSSLNWNDVWFNCYSIADCYIIVHRIYARSPVASHQFLCNYSSKNKVIFSSLPFNSSLTAKYHMLGIVLVNISSNYNQMQVMILPPIYHFDGGNLKIDLQSKMNDQHSLTMKLFLLWNTITLRNSFFTSKCLRSALIFQRKSV